MSSSIESTQSQSCDIEDVMQEPSEAAGDTTVDNQMSTSTESSSSASSSQQVFETSQPPLPHSHNACDNVTQFPFTDWLKHALDTVDEPQTSQDYQRMQLSRSAPHLGYDQELHQTLDYARSTGRWPVTTSASAFSLEPTAAIAFLNQIQSGSSFNAITPFYPTEDTARSKLNIEFPSLQSNYRSTSPLAAKTFVAGLQSTMTAPHLPTSAAANIAGEAVEDNDVTRNSAFSHSIRRDILGSNVDLPEGCSQFPDGLPYPSWQKSLSVPRFGMVPAGTSAFPEHGPALANVQCSGSDIFGEQVLVPSNNLNSALARDTVYGFPSHSLWASGQLFSRSTGSQAADSCGSSVDFQSTTEPTRVNTPLPMPHYDDHVLVAPVPKRFFGGLSVLKTSVDTFKKRRQGHSPYRNDKQCTDFEYSYDITLPAFNIEEDDPVPYSTKTAHDVRHNPPRSEFVGEETKRAVCQPPKLGVGDLYTPRFVKGHRTSRQGWCDCGEWLGMKSSVYNYHCSVNHGISCRTGRPFHPPKQLRFCRALKLIDAQCAHCGEWINIMRKMMRQRTWKNWFVHAAHCHHKAVKPKVAVLTSTSTPTSGLLSMGRTIFPEEGTASNGSSYDNSADSDFGVMSSQGLFSKSGDDSSVFPAFAPNGVCGPEQDGDAEGEEADEQEAEGSKRVRLDEF